MNVENNIAATLRAQTHDHEQIVLFKTSALPDVIYQNTGRGWWNESTVCETLRTPCGGDSTKANLVVEVNG